MPGIIQQFRIRSQVRVWLIPTLYLIAALVLGRATASLQLPPIIPGQLGFHYTTSTATSILASIATGMLTFTGFVFSMITVMIQYGSTQYSPRITSYLLRSKVVQHALGVFIATFVYSLAALSRVDIAGTAYVPDVPILMSLSLVLSSTVMFIALIQSVANLQVVNVLQMIGSRGREIIEDLYPAAYTTDGRLEATSPTTMLPAVTQIMHYYGGPMAVAKVDIRTLVLLAQRVDAVIEVEYSVGDIVPDGGPLLRLHGGKRQIPEWQLRAAILLGSQRTIEQDPKYAIRLIADVACKALSAAINDPTTAVQAIDQLDNLLRRIGSRHLDVGYIYDKQGALRVVYPTPTWEDFVGLALDEIRFFGASSFQVARRLRALFEDLVEALPLERRTAIQQQRLRLDAAIERAYVDLEDRAEARQADRQGIGLSSRWVEGTPVPAVTSGDSNSGV
jgi:uncharacterized membrane protein